MIEQSRRWMGPILGICFAAGLLTVDAADWHLNALGSTLEK
jgi:hypothetical protein